MKLQTIAVAKLGNEDTHGICLATVQLFKPESALLDTTSQSALSLLEEKTNELGKQLNRQRANSLTKDIKALNKTTDSIWKEIKATLTRTSRSVVNTEKAKAAALLTDFLKPYWDSETQSTSTQTANFAEMFGKYYASADMHTVQMTYNSTRLLPDGTLVYFDQNWKSHFYPVRNTDFGVDLTIVNDVFVDRENNLWIATDCGVYNFYNLNIEEYRLNLAKSDNIWSIIEDNEQNMWFGSYGSGLWRLDNELRLREMKQPFVGWKEQYMNSRKNKAGTLFFPSGCGLVKFEHGQVTNFVANA